MSGTKENENSSKRINKEEIKPIVKQTEILEYKIQSLSSIIYDLHKKLSYVLNKEPDDEQGKGETPNGDSELYLRLQDSSIKLENLERFINYKIITKLEI